MKLVRPEKRAYDILRAQGVPGEPFIPLLGPLIYLYQRQPLQQTNNSKIQN